jgi:hypothetical protein
LVDLPIAPDLNQPASKNREITTADTQASHAADQAGKQLALRGAGRK